MVQELSPAGKIIWKIAVVVQAVMGFTMGLYLFTYGPLFYESFAASISPQLAMTFTGLIFSINFAAIALFEIPTGAIGDAVGRKWSVVWSLAFRMAFFLLMAAFARFSSPAVLLPLGILSVIVFALGYALFSGSFTAWCVDSLRRAEPGMGYEHLLSNAYLYSFLSQIFGGVLGVVFYLNKLPHMGFLLGAWVCVACIIYCLQQMRDDEVSGMQLSDLRFETINRRMGEIISVGFKVFRKSNIILTLVMMFASYMVVLNIVDYLWPVFLRSSFPQEVQGRYWVMLVVVTLLACSLGSKVFKFWMGQKGLKTGVKTTPNLTLTRWLVFACFISSVPIIWLGWLTSRDIQNFWYFVIAILPVLFAYGIIAPCFETLVNNHIPPEHAGERATILSFASLVRSVMVMLLAIPAGGSSGATTTVGWIIPAALLLTVTIAGGYLLKRKHIETAEKVTVPVTNDL